MTEISMTHAHAMPDAPGRLRAPTVALIGFLTLVDLFATQAILPSLSQHYGVSAAEIGIAANATTAGMAVAGLIAGLIGAHVERRMAIGLSLGLLAIPTALLAFAPNLTVFALLRVTQGLFMATAFTLTLTYLNEKCSRTAATTALAAYVTGGVASNLVGRLTAALVAGLVGASASFFFFAALNLAGAGLISIALTRAEPMTGADQTGSHFWSAWAGHLTDSRMLRAFAIGFLVLFGFIGTFSYVGFELMAPPLALSMTTLGLVFFVFLPSMVTTPLAGGAARRFGTGRTMAAALALAVLGLALMLLPRLEVILAGLVVVGVGTFFAQAVATSFVGRAAARDRAAASGLYLTFYYCGGLCGAALIGLLYDAFGWNAALAGNMFVLAAGALLAHGTREPEIV